MALKQLDYHLKIEATETPVLGLDEAANPDVVHKIASQGPTRLTSSTTPSVNDVWSDKVQLVSGSAILNFAALTGSSLPTKDMTGKRLKAWHFRAPAANTAKVRIKAAASFPYNLFGTGGFLELFPADAACAVTGNASLPVVSTTERDIEITSADLDAECDIVLVFGP